MPLPSCLPLGALMLRPAEQTGKHGAMLDDPSCPACGERSWELVGKQVFERSGPAVSNDYLRLRYRVLFELWSPHSPRFEASFVLCTACGMVIYTPRATAEEIDAKYRMIAAEQRKSEASAAGATATATATATTSASASKLDAERSAELHAALAPHLAALTTTSAATSDTPPRLLDFGGGKGALLSRFAAAGFRCGVVDYTPVTVPGVERLGDTLDDLPPEARFELALCSHVFEHVAEPVAMAEALAARLVPGGLLFIEVPLELLGGPPTMREPVTHVSFFCESSLSVTLARAGVELLDCRTEATLVGSGAYRYGVRALARRPREPDARADAHVSRSVPLPGAVEARRLLAAGPLSRASWAAAHPRMMLNPLRSLRRRLSP